MKRHRHVQHVKLLVLTFAWGNAMMRLVLPSASLQCVICIWVNYLQFYILVTFCLLGFGLKCRSVQESKPSAREGVGLKFKDPQADLTIRSSPVKSAGFDLKVQNVHQNATSIDVCDTYYTYAFGNKKLRMRFLMLFAVISTAFLSSAGQATGSRARGQERRSEERGS